MILVLGGKKRVRETEMTSKARGEALKQRKYRCVPLCPTRFTKMDQTAEPNGLTKTEAQTLPLKS